MADTNDKQNAGKQSETDRLVDDALKNARSAVNDMQKDADSARGGAAAMSMPDFGTGGGDAPKLTGIELLSDVDLHVTIELGRTQMLVEDVLKLNEGSVVELDKLAGDPVDVYVNGRLVARGEVLVLNDNFCIRVSEIVANLDEEEEGSVLGDLKKAADGGAANAPAGGTPAK